MPTSTSIIPQHGSVSKLAQTTGNVGRFGPSLEGVSTNPDFGVRSPKTSQGGSSTTPDFSASPGPAPDSIQDGGNDAASTPAGSALGTYGKNASVFVKDAASALVHRYYLQSAARRLLPCEGVSTCLRCRQGGKEFVDLWHIPEVNKARYGGLQTCSSVWHCPVCAAKITERRRVEVRAGIDAWKARGGDVALVTFTVRHKSGDALALLIKGLMRSLRRISSGWQGGVLRGLHGVVGNIRSVEVTYGLDNGWHPHIHMLIFVEGPMCQFDKLWLHYRKQWDAALRLENMREVTARGVDMRWANEDVAEYVAKMGNERTWDIEQELAKGPSKMGRGDHYSPIQLLSMYAACPEETDTHTGEVKVSLPGRLWSTYAHEMKGTHQLRWSPGLRALLGLAKSKSDQEVAADVDKLGLLLTRLDKTDWATVLYFDARADLLNVAAFGDLARVNEYLVELSWSMQQRELARVATSLQPGPTVQQEHAGYALRKRQRDLADFIAQLDQDEAEADALGLTLTEFRDLQQRLSDFGEGLLLEVPQRRTSRRSELPQR